MILFFKTTIATLYGVSRLVLSPIVNRPAAQQQHRVWVVAAGAMWWSYPLCGHSPTRVEVESGL